MNRQIIFRRPGINLTVILLLLICVTTPISGIRADEISTGTVIDVRGDTVSIELATGPAPAIGDIAELGFELGGEQFVVGTWRVTKLLGPVIEATRVKAELAADKGMTVRFSKTATGKVPAAAPATPPVAPPATQKMTRPQTAPVQAAVQFITTSEYQAIWKDIGSGADVDFAVWRPVAKNGYYPLGDVANAGPWPGERYGKPSFDTLLVKGGKPPVGFRKIWSSAGSFSDTPFSSWVAVAPQGYRCLGDVGTTSLDQMPATDTIRCVPEDCIVATPLQQLIWEDTGSGADLDFSAWLVPVVNTYIGNAAHAKPRGNFYTINEACR